VKDREERERSESVRRRLKVNTSSAARITRRTLSINYAARLVMNDKRYNSAEVQSRVPLCCCDRARRSSILELLHRVGHAYKKVVCKVVTV